MLAARVTELGGRVTRELAVINALEVELPADTAARLGGSVGRLWPNAHVQVADSADPGTIYAPVGGTEVTASSFDLARVVACDDERDKLDEVPVAPDDDIYQAYLFSPGLPSGATPSGAQVQFRFKEKNLALAYLDVFQASTHVWHRLPLNTLETDDAFIDATLDLTGLLAAPEDYRQVAVRFGATRLGGEKAEVDCARLALTYDGQTIALAPAEGYETRPEDFDLEDILTLDGHREDFDDIPRSDIRPNAYQGFLFAPAVDPSTLPELVDLRLVFKEKGLRAAQVQVFQSSTGEWHVFPIDTTLTEDALIDVTLDIAEAFTTAADFERVRVRLYTAQFGGGEKAEVDLVSLRLASLIGAIVDTEPVDGFAAVNAAAVWDLGYTGNGIGVAVLDTGVKAYKQLKSSKHQQDGGLVDGYNVLKGRPGTQDKNGHGTMVASIISNRDGGADGRFFGVAPNSHIIPVQVLDKEGRGTYADIIAGIDWVLANRETLNIRVMNLSFSAPVRSYYWDDPLNQAVMRAWEAGIVVIVAAGNGGPNPMTIGVPANNPYVVTVGAITDAYTPADWSDDYVPAFSAAGPTVEGFVKPEVVAPGGHILGLMHDKSQLAVEHPQGKVDKDYYELSGTSMSAAQVSGVVALMLERNPALTPDEVKHRLLSTALASIGHDGSPAYSIFQQGAGRIDAFGAVFAAGTGAANVGLDVSLDLAGIQHFGGPAAQDAAGRFVVRDTAGQVIGDGFAWSGNYIWSNGFAWSGNYIWSNGFAWSGNYIWSNGFAWSGNYIWSNGFAWSGNVTWSTVEVNMNQWVAPE